MARVEKAVEDENGMFDGDVTVISYFYASL